MKPHLLTLVMVRGSAADAWETLRVLLEDDIASRRDDLETELTCLSLDEGQSMIKFIGRAKGIRDALATASKHVNENSLALNIMRGLARSYKAMKQVLRGMANTPGGLRLADVSAKLLYAEKEVAADDEGGSSSKPAVFAAAEDKKRAAVAATTPQRSDKTYYYCDKPGDFQRDCRKLKPDREDKRHKRDGGRGS